MLDGPIPPLIVIAGSIALAWCRRLLIRAPDDRRRWADAAVVLVVVLLAAALELKMGRAPTYRNGPVRLWSGDINSDQNSQQFLDPYSLTHVVHGVVFYGLTRVVLPVASFPACALVVVTVEAAWEVYENTDQIINRYRAETVSRGYYGDSILNSMSDILMCVIGLMLARRLPVAATVVGAVTIEAILALWIRDNLTLNVIMLVHPIKAIRLWQAGG